MMCVASGVSASAGDEPMRLPSTVHCDQAPFANSRNERPLMALPTTICSDPGPAVLTPGEEYTPPPRFSQGCQPPLFASYHLCCSSLVTPRRNRSMRPGPHEAAEGGP